MIEVTMAIQMNTHTRKISTVRPPHNTEQTDKLEKSQGQKVQEAQST